MLFRSRKKSMKHGFVKAAALTPGIRVADTGYKMCIRDSCESAELFLNGKSYGRKAYAYPAYGMTERYVHFDKAPVPVNTDDLFLSGDVPYIPGYIELVGYMDGREAVRHTVRTAGEPAAVKLHCYRSEMKMCIRDSYILCG